MASPRVLSLLIAIMSVMAASANGAIPEMIRCTFESCSAQIIQNVSLEVSCQGRAMYRGPYVLNTDFRTIQLESPSMSGPKIVTQSLPCPLFASKAKLFIEGRQIDGICELVEN